MTIANIGNVNVSALNVPQVLVQIVPPQFLFNGVSTNVNGIVGTASWGPVDLPMSFGNYAQCQSIFGPTINRNYDLGGHVILGEMQGAGYWSAVRVTDTTDTASSASVIATGGAYAANTITFVSNPTSGGITLNGTLWTFVSSISGAFQILIGSTLALTLAAAAASLNASVETNTAKMTYSASATVLTCTSVAIGTAGNSLTLASSAVPTATAVSPLAGGTAGTSGVTWTAKYTGSLGNSVKVTLAKGSAANSYKVIVSNPYLATEIFDNVASNLTGIAVWTAIVSAINNGSSSTRPNSNIIVATVGTATAAPTPGSSVTLVGGTDGASGITTAYMLGQDALLSLTSDINIGDTGGAGTGMTQVQRSGMYALRNQGVAQFSLCDLSDITALSAIIAFATDIGAYAIFATPASDTIANAAAELSQYGIDAYTAKVIFGDWVIWNDTVTMTPTRMTSPAAVTLGMLGNRSPQINLLNKPVNGIVGTQSSLLGKSYSYSDFQNLSAARMDVIALDKTITNNFVHRLGINTSSNQITMGDEYTRVIYFLAKSINIVGAQYLGANMDPTEMLNAKVALQQFLALAQTNKIIYTFDGSQAYQVVLDTTNNTQMTAALGYQYAYIKAIIGPIVRFFIINLEGGSSVTISNTPPTS